MLGTESLDGVFCALNLGGTGINTPDNFSYRSNFRFRSRFRFRSIFRSRSDFRSRSNFDSSFSFSFSFRSSFHFRFRSRSSLVLQQAATYFIAAVAGN